LIVYLRVGSCPDPQSVACLSMVGVNSAKRFVQITFVMQAHGDKTVLAAFTDHLIAEMGHELQHAIEVADDPSVVDGPTLESAYKRWGFRPDPKATTYESERAIRSGRAVLNDLHSTRPRPTNGGEMRTAASVRSVPRPVYIIVVDRVGVPPDVLTGAAAEVVRIYETIGVQMILVREVPAEGGVCLFVS